MTPSPQWIEPVLAAALWQSTAWLAVGLAAAGLLRRRPARAHAVLVICVAAAALTPALSVAFRVTGLGLLPAVNRSIDVAELAARLSGDDGRAVASAPLTWAYAAAAAWLAAAALAATRLAVSAWRGRRLLADATPLERGPVVELARRAAERLDVRAQPLVYESAAVRCPVIWCWGTRPKLILPARRREPAGLLGVLCHELAHYKRRDHLWSLAGEIVLCLLPWHPLAWLAARRLGDLCEQACDTWAVTAVRSPATYAEALLEMVPQPALALAPAAVGRRGTVARRIERILGSGEPAPVRPTSGRRCILLLGVAASLAVTGASLAHRRPPTIEVVADNGKSAPLTGPDVIAIPRELDLGVAGPGEAASAEIVLCNRSTRTRAVFAATPSCGCTTVGDFEPQVLSPGECMKLEIAMTAPAEPGTRKTKTVTFDIEGQDPLELAVHLAAGTAS